MKDKTLFKGSRQRIIEQIRTEERQKIIKEIDEEITAMRRITTEYNDHEYIDTCLLYKMLQRKKTTKNL